MYIAANDQTVNIARTFEVGFNINDDLLEAISRYVTSENCVPRLDGGLLHKYLGNVY